MDVTRGAALLAAAFLAGLVAGLFASFSHAVMPGLGRTTDAVFVAGFRAIDRAISNPWQAAGFVGAPAAMAVAAALHTGGAHRATLVWVLTALVLYGSMVAITFRVHLPLNRLIQAAGDAPDRAELAAARGAFEHRWVRWNLARAALSAAAFGCLLPPLVLHGGAA